MGKQEQRGCAEGTQIYFIRPRLIKVMSIHPQSTYFSYICQTCSGKSQIRYPSVIDHYSTEGNQQKVIIYVPYI